MSILFNNVCTHIRSFNAQIPFVNMKPRFKEKHVLTHNQPTELQKNRNNIPAEK